MIKDFVLNNGIKVPAVGYGTYLSTEGGEEALKLALNAGYRFFDTASFYIHWPKQDNYGDDWKNKVGCKSAGTSRWLYAECRR